MYNNDKKSHFQDSLIVSEEKNKQFKEQPENQNGEDFDDNFDDE